MIGILHTPEGKIVGVLSGSPEALAMDFAASEHEGLLLEEGESVALTTHYVKDGQARLYPAQPSKAHEFNFTTEAWELNLETLRSLRWAEMKAHREAEEFGGLVYGGNTYDTDALSQQRIQGAVQLAQLDMANFSIDWTLADNTAEVLDGPQMLGLGVALGNHISAAHTKGRGVRALIDTAVDEAGLASITWPI